MKKMKWYSFDQYKIKAFNICCFTLPTDKLKWDEDVYNCPAFFKNFMCKHVIGMAIRLNHCKPPPAAKDVNGCPRINKPLSILSISLPFFIV